MSSSQSNVKLFNYVYTTALPATLTVVLKIADQNQLINEVLNFLFALLDVRGSTEFSEFLNQYFIQKFPIQGDKVKQLFDAFLSKDLKQLKALFKEFKQMYQQVNLTYPNI